MSLFSFSFYQRVFRVCARLSFALTAFTAYADIAVWEFNDSANRGLTRISNSVSDVSFDTGASGRSEEHTPELQSRGQLVCRLLLEKKKTSCRRRQLIAPTPRHVR